MRERPQVSVSSRPFPGLTGVGYGDIAYVAAALLLTSVAVGVTSGLTQTPHLRGTGVGPAIGVLGMTVPVLFARRAPRAAAATVAGGAVLNGIVFPGITRCGAAFPAALVIAFAVGAHTGSRRDTSVGMALVGANLLAQSVSDPKLGLGAILFLFPVSVGFCVIGRLVASRSAAAATLRRRNAELAHQREATARLAVAADQERIAEDLEDVLHQGIAAIVSFATAGRRALSTRPEDALAAFVAIQETGRHTLGHMRGVVGHLRDPAPTVPEPALAELRHLIEGAGLADARLEVIGEVRSLPPGLEVSGYRIVEHLLSAVDGSDPAARVDVRVTFRPDALELRFVGPTWSLAARPSALAAAEQRAAFHGGTVRCESVAGRREAIVSLPVATGRA